MIGETIGNYRVLSLLGAGGMGEVYLAEQLTIATRVAIKVLLTGISQDKEHVDRFFNEARATNKVRHAGPVKIFDVGFHNGHAFLVMEHLEGESLAARIRRLGVLPGEQVADIARQIAGVLEAVHAAGITHRDLKPDNIFLVPDSELGERVRVLDFGIAKLTGTMSGPQTKGTMGTPAYMAPEQWNNSANVDGRADTYSLGCVLFEMAVGRPPFPATSIGEACTHHLHSQPPRASEVAPHVPPEFDALLERMLAKLAEQRPTLKEVARTVDTLRTSGVTQRWSASHSASNPAVSPTLLPSVVAPSLLAEASQPHASAQHASTQHASAQHPSAQHPSAQHPSAQHPSAQHPSAQHPSAQHPSTPPYAQTPSAQHPSAQPPFAQQPSHVPPRRKRSIAPFAIAGVLVAGGVTAAVILGRGDPKPTLVDSGLVVSIDAAKPIEAEAPKPPREWLAATNPFRDFHGVRMLTRQLTGADYKRLAGKPPPVAADDDAAPLGWLSQTEAVALCATIDARLPTSDEWTKAAAGSWGIGEPPGPLQDWTSTVKDELAVVRGGHAQMPKDAFDKSARTKPPHMLQKDAGVATAANRARVAGATIGVRCVDGTQSAEASSDSKGNAASKGSVGDNGGSGSSGLDGLGGGLGGPRRRPVDPIARLGAPVITGNLDKAIIRRVIRRSIGKASYCYQTRLRAKPDLQGTVTARFTIAGSGTVASSTATGFDSEVSACIAHVIKGLAFPTSQGTTDVIFPFTFRPAAAD